MKKVKGNWGSIFKTAMDEQGIKIDTLCIACKIPKRTMYAYLSDEIEPNATNFVKIVNHLKIVL